ncbi:MAG: holo-[acyl-carrier-protein] synthase [Pirellulaceae bacterium]|nr:MAG: holo-[acyl-carrier-protein] synthase [Pirellulaceae bacterium]
MADDNVVSMGTAVVECARIGQLIQRHEERFLRRVFTDKEIRYCSSRRASMQQYAARWAVKQAAFQALGVAAHRGVRWTEIEVPDGRGPNIVELTGTLGRLMQRKKISCLLASWGFCRSYAVGFVLAFSSEPQPRSQ